MIPDRVVVSADRRSTKVRARVRFQDRRFDGLEPVLLENSIEGVESNKHRSKELDSGDGSLYQLADHFGSNCNEPRSLLWRCGRRVCHVDALPGPRILHLARHGRSQPQVGGRPPRAVERAVDHGRALLPACANGARDHKPLPAIESDGKPAPPMAAFGVLPRGLCNVHNRSPRPRTPRKRLPPHSSLPYPLGNSSPDASVGRNAPQELAAEALRRNQRLPPASPHGIGELRL
jgi:hypothetical protein